MEDYITRKIARTDPTRILSAIGAPDYKAQSARYRVDYECAFTVALTYLSGKKEELRGKHFESARVVYTLPGETLDDAIRRDAVRRAPRPAGLVLPLPSGATVRIGRKKLLHKSEEWYFEVSRLVRSDPELKKHLLESARSTNVRIDNLWHGQYLVAHPESHSWENAMISTYDVLTRQ